MNRRTVATLGVAPVIGAVLGGMAYYLTGDLPTALIAALPWTLGIALLGYLSYRYPYDELGRGWESNRDGALALVLVLLLSGIGSRLAVPDASVIAMLVAGAGLVGYMGGVLHLAENTDSPSTG